MAGIALRVIIFPGIFMKLYNEIKSTIIKAYPELSDAEFDIQPSPENQNGDIGLSCFRFAKLLKKVEATYPAIALK